MTAINQSATADLLSTAKVITLPGTLGNGLAVAHFFGAGQSQGLRNFAPGGVQGAAVVGSPVWGTGFVTLQSKTNYITTPYLAAQSQTWMVVGRAPGPFDASHAVIYYSNFGSGASPAGTTNYGDAAQITQVTTAPQAKVDHKDFYYNGSIMAGQTLTMTDATETAFHCMIFRNDDTAKTITGENKTAASGRLSLSVAAVTRVPNPTQGFWFGAYPTQITPLIGNSDTCLIMQWNRATTPTEDTAAYVWAQNFLNRKYSITI